MKSFMTIISAMMISAVAMTATAEINVNAADSAHQSVGLVLSGGGAKGIAHIGVIKALEDNDIPIDFITGTSMGAIVGGLYAAGYTPEEMMQLLLSRGFSYWSTGKVDPNLVYYFSSPAPTPSLYTWHLNLNDSVARASAVPASIIAPMPMSFAFMDLFAAYTAQCESNFNNLFVPFRCVASDAAAKHKIVFSHGNLGDAIRASMSFPIIFQPITIDSTLMYDGGIYDNFPVNVMERDFAPSIMIGVDVSASSKGPQTSLMDQIENLVMQKSDYSLPADRGIKLRINLNEFSLLDFPKAQQIYDIGYAHAMQMIDSIKGRIHSRTPQETRNLKRAVFKSRTPAVNFSHVNVTGASPSQNKFLEYMFQPVATDTFGIERARRAFYRAISPGTVKDMFPQAVYNASDGTFDLNIKAAMKGSVKLGLGAFITSSTNSYIFVNAGYQNPSFNAVSADIDGWIGQSYMAGVLKSRMVMRTPVPTDLQLEVVASRQKFYENDYLFYQDKLPTFIINHEYFARLRWGIALGSLWRLNAGAGIGYLKDSFFRTNSPTYYVLGRDRSSFNLAQAILQASHNTLSDINFPVRGSMYDFTALAVTGNHKLRAADESVADHSTHPRWLQLELRTRNYFQFSNTFSLGLESDILLSTRKLLPDYSSTIISAPAFRPTPSSYNSFNPAFRANSFVAVGVVPVYTIMQSLTTRLNLHTFLPLRKIYEDPLSGAPYYGKWLRDPVFFGQLDITYTLPFASISAYCNYTNKPKGDWNAGVSFGIFILAPKFLR